MPSVNSYNDIFYAIEKELTQSSPFYYIKEHNDFSSGKGLGHDYMQIGVQGSRIICCNTKCHYEVRVDKEPNNNPDNNSDNNPNIYVMIHLEWKKFDQDKDSIISDFLEKECGLIKSTLSRPSKDGWWWYYKKGSEIPLSDVGGERSVSDIVKDVMSQLEELDNAITNGIYKLLSM